MNHKALWILFFMLWVLLFGLSKKLCAQSSPSSTKTVAKSLTSVKLEPLNLSLYQERNLFNISTTIVYGLGTYYSFYNNTFPPLLGARFIAERSNLFGRDYATSAITPYALIGLRKYITLGKRIPLNKNTENKAGSYVALLLEYPLTEKVIEEEINNLEIAVPISVWFGLRRSLSTRFFFAVEGGLGLKKSKTVREIVPRLNASINYRLR